MGPIVRLVGSGIGLASEAIAARKASKADKERAQAQASSTPRGPSFPPAAPSASREPSPEPPAYSSLDPSSADYGLVEAHDEDHARQLIQNGHAVPWNDPHEGHHEDEENDDEAYWELDEEAAALEDAPPYEESDTPGYRAEDGSESTGKEQEIDVHKLVKKFLEAHPAPASGPPTHPLPCPVIIPQKRPHSKSRGFVHAYAPALESCGVDQASFIEFLDVFHKASQASPVFEVIFLGGHILGYVPLLSAQITSMIVQHLALAAIIIQGRHRTNTFLDEINSTYLRPRGLYAMLMSYKPSRYSWSSAPTNINHSIAKSAEPEGLSHKFTNNLKFSGGKSHTELEIPEAAPLIFPTLDAAAKNANAETPAKKENAFKKSTHFIGDYMDRRAQAEYNDENPHSSLSVPQEKPFASRFADPTHPASNGSLISLVTGGKVVRQPRLRGLGPVGRIRKATGTDKPIRKMLRQNVLYLMIVNMPTEEEMAEAKREMEREKKEGKHHRDHHEGEQETQGPRVE